MALQRAELTSEEWQIDGHSLIGTLRDAGSVDWDIHCPREKSGYNLESCEGPYGECVVRQWLHASGPGCIWSAAGGWHGRLEKRTPIAWRLHGEDVEAAMMIVHADVVRGARDQATAEVLMDMGRLARP